VHLPRGNIDDALTYPQPFRRRRSGRGVGHRGAALDLGRCRPFPRDPPHSAKWSGRIGQV